MKAILLLILSSIILLYIPLNRQTPKYRLNIGFDHRIPLLPWTVWIYFSYYLLLPLSIILTWNSRFATSLLVTQIVATAIATILWKIFPNGVIRPQVEVGNRLNERLLRLIYSHDKDCNGLPSGHVLHSFVSCFYLAKLYPQMWVVFFLLLFAISFSTLTTKQHYFVDMIGTLALAPFIIELSSIIHL
ncbi:MAG: phosphoesterase, PA-phosphatase related protein [uncultured bacterium]|nr:MAG: phosphoesterase, PA-phosphatase related protein [uncultured bacterium]